jgi:hypothetical protein
MHFYSGLLMYFCSGVDTYANRRRDTFTELLSPLNKDHTLSMTGVSSGLPAPPKSPQDKTTPHDAAFDACLARVNAAAESFLEEGEQVLWIHDHRGSSKDERHTKTGLHWAKYLIELGWDPINLAYVGEHAPLRVADSIYFGHSHESLALQLVDVCCWTIGRRILETMYDRKPSFISPYYAIIQRRIMNDGTPPLFRDWGKGSR